MELAESNIPILWHDREVMATNTFTRGGRSWAREWQTSLDDVIVIVRV
jgi:hypothetical protein